METFIVLGLCVGGLLTLVSLAVNAFLIPKFIQSNQQLKETRVQLKQAGAEGMEAVRSLWIRELPRNVYRNEIEVEVKFIYPLLRFLGFTADDIKLRVPVNVQVGRQKVGGFADWVVMANQKPLYVIEAKEPAQGLNPFVQAQARSYTYAMNITTYVITNGRDLQVYCRGNETDTKIFQCSIHDMDKRWNEVKKAIGKPEIAS